MVGMARIVWHAGQFQLNPPASRTEQADINLAVSGTATSIVMVEGEMREVPEEQLVEALRAAHTHIQRLVEFLRSLQAAAGKPKIELPASPTYPEVEAWLTERARPRLTQILSRPPSLSRSAEKPLSSYSQS